MAKPKERRRKSEHVGAGVNISNARCEPGPEKREVGKENEDLTCTKVASNKVCKSGEEGGGEAEDVPRQISVHTVTK